MWDVDIECYWLSPMHGIACSYNDFELLQTSTQPKQLFNDVYNKVNEKVRDTPTINWYDHDA